MNKKQFTKKFLAVLALASLAALWQTGYSAPKFKNNPKLKGELLNWKEASEKPVSIAGVYPSLTMYNDEGECGTGAVVPWAGRLWVITYGPHKPHGSSDKLYEITPSLKQVIRPESIGGTPANRMIHKESNQLSIGPYFIDEKGKVRVIPYTSMPGRHTGTARHLKDPANKVYIATMEEGLYSVDVHDLSVVEHIKDANPTKRYRGQGIATALPGYHGKGLYSSQGTLVYANNGEHGKNVRTDPTVTSGALASWQGSGDWKLVRRNQFTEVTGPGGIYGNADEKDPLWAMGWDARSLILMLLEDGKWHSYRLPKGSHSYDGAHGWNTEWPRIREIGEDDLLATMHGTFWRFPKGFSKTNSGGIAPRSNYLKVIGDFARWKGRIVFGCDDSAQKEFLNHRPFKSTKGAPLQSNSNLWFVETEKIDKLGPAIGRGSAWLRDDLEAGAVSEPYLFSGYDHRMMVIRHGNQRPVTFTMEVDKKGDGKWAELDKFKVKGSLIHIFKDTENGAWIRLRVAGNAKGVTVHFHYRDKDRRGKKNGPIFDGISTDGAKSRSKGVIRSNRKVLSMLAGGAYYELTDRLELTRGAKSGAALVAEGAQPETKIRVDGASAIVEEDGASYRIPVSPGYEENDEAAKNPESGRTLEELLSRNLAKGATVTASGKHGEYTATKAVDGSMSEDSRWIVRGPGSLELDLGEEKAFRSVYLASGWKRDSQHAAKNFDFQVKMGGEWKTLPGGKIRDNSGWIIPVLLADPVKARQLRLLFKDEGFNRVYEIAVFADQPEIASHEASNLHHARVCREVATERDLFNFGGTFYELPARNAQGFAKIRPIATHNLKIHDYASHFGLLFLTGLNGKEGTRIIKSTDGKLALWAGVIDDLWQLGKPRGIGGVWKNSKVQADEPSLPYLMTGYDRKSVTISTQDDSDITLEIDIDGTGLWVPYKTFNIQAGVPAKHAFPEGFSAYWIRAVSSVDTTATVTFRYE
jgi:hypothetical protein